MTAGAITFSGIMWDRLVVIDVAILLALAVVQYLSLRPLNQRDSDEDAVRSAAASSMGVAAGAGISAVGILVPLTLLTVQRIVSGDAPLRFVITEDLFVSECWFALSLALGLLVLWFVAFKAPTRNVTRAGSEDVEYFLSMFCWNPLKPDAPEHVRTDLQFIRQQAFRRPLTDASREEWLLSFVRDEAFTWTNSELYDAQQDGVERFLRFETEQRAT